MFLLTTYVIRLQDIIIQNETQRCFAGIITMDT